MSRIICITGWFDIYRRGVKTGEKEFTVSHGIDEETLAVVILPCEHPSKLGAVWDGSIMEYVLVDHKSVSRDTN